MKLKLDSNLRGHSNQTKTCLTLHPHQNTAELLTQCPKKIELAKISTHSLHSSLPRLRVNSKVYLNVLEVKYYTCKLKQWLFAF